MKGASLPCPSEDHDPSADADGLSRRAADCEIQAKEILKTRDTDQPLFEQTRKDYEEIKQAIDRDNWFTSEEAMEFGLLDRIVKNRSELLNPFGNPILHHRHRQRVD